MTNEAQSALRKTMEDNSEITRFCFIGNYINQIINPITSRCAKFRFKPLNDNSMLDKLTSIAQNEKLKLNDGTLKVIVKMADGDMRKAIMLLQNLQYVNIDDGELTVEDVYDIAGCIAEKQLRMVKGVCITSKEQNADSIIKLAKNIRASGYPIYNVLNQIHSMVINSKHLDDRMKSIICLHFAKTEKRLIDGADEYLQLLSIFMCIKSVSMDINSIFQNI